MKRPGWSLAGLAGLALATSFAVAAQSPGQLRSGFEFMSRETQGIQEDDSSNPGFLWVSEGEQLWNAKAGTAAVACSDCHGSAAGSMKGVAARYPAWSDEAARPVTLEGRVNQCRTNRQKDEPLAQESRELLAITAYIGLQSRGLPIASPKDARLSPFRAKGEAIYRRRMGQLDLSCADCHDHNVGRRLSGSLIPQGHPTGYPLYRLEWQDLGSLQRRFRNCLIGVRAEPLPPGSDDATDLELYLMSRAAGLPIETPAVRP